MLGYGPDSPLKRAQINTNLMNKFSALEEFWRGIKAENTKRGYTGGLEDFLGYLRGKGELKFKGSLEKPKSPFDAHEKPVLEKAAEGLKQKATADPKWVYWCIASYYDSWKDRIDKVPLERRDSAANTFWSCHKAVKKFCDQNDIQVNWKKALAPMKRPKDYSNDLKYEVGQIQKLLKDGDPRAKTIILLLTSAGIDAGGIELLKVKHVKPVYSENGKDVVAAWIHTYKRKTDTWYDTLITEECYHEIKVTLDQRLKDGEMTVWDPDSPIVRNLYYPQKNARKEAKAWEPKPLQTEGVLEVVKDALENELQRKVLPEGQTRHEVKTTCYSGSWITASNVKATAYVSICGSIPVSALAGTPITIGEPKSQAATTGTITQNSTSSATTTTTSVAPITTLVSTTTNGGGGVPGFPYQGGEVTALLVTLAGAYLLARRRVRSA